MHRTYIKLYRLLHVLCNSSVRIFIVPRTVISHTFEVALPLCAQRKLNVYSCVRYFIHIFLHTNMCDCVYLNFDIDKIRSGCCVRARSIVTRNIFPFFAFHLLCAVAHTKHIFHSPRSTHYDYAMHHNKYTIHRRRRRK